MKKLFTTIGIRAALLDKNKSLQDSL